MRTIFVRVTDEPSPMFAPVLATMITSTTFTIGERHPDYADDELEFDVGADVRCKVEPLRGPDDDKPRQRMIAIERVGQL